MQFAALDAYLDALGPKDRMAVLPVPLVAAWIGVTPPAVKQMLRRGALQPVRIGRSEFVQAASVQAWREAFEADLAKVRKVLTKAARKRQTVTYADLLAKLGRSYENPGDRRRIGRLMQALGGETLARDDVLLPVVAVSKLTGQPKHGVWEMAAERGWWAEGQAPERFLAAHRETLAQVFAKETN